MSLLNTPPKGTSDWFPKEFTVRKYIFDTRRIVCKKFGYEEYMGPLVENAEIRRAKSGEDVGGSELTLITDRTGKISDLALRPEMTPTVTRMVSRIYQQEPKPIRFFSIANFYRNERPQRGRNREFWQLNIDIFGSQSSYADLEMLQVVIESMLAFQTPKNSWKLYLNSRDIIDFIIEQEVGVVIDQKVDVVRMMDKWEKMEKEDFVDMLRDFGLNDKQIDTIVTYLSIDDIKSLSKNFPSIAKDQGYIDVLELFEKLAILGYADYFQFRGSLIRGFDYYDGLVFEVFDLHPNNNRAMFGGGRYNGLAEIFGGTSFPAVGFASGDEAMKLFLESRGMIDAILATSKSDVYYIPMLDETYYDTYYVIAKSLREAGHLVEQGLEIQDIRKALQYANKKNIAYVVLLGKEEMKKNIYKIKNMTTSEEQEISL